MHKWNNRKFEQADSIKSSNYLFYFGLGAGLEIPIGKLWSVLPSISYLSNTNDFIESSKNMNSTDKAYNLVSVLFIDTTTVKIIEEDNGQEILILGHLLTSIA